MKLKNAIAMCVIHVILSYRIRSTVEHLHEGFDHIFVFGRHIRSTHYSIAAIDVGAVDLNLAALGYCTCDIVLDIF